MTTHKKIPIEIRRMKKLGAFSAVMRHNAQTAERAWHDLTASGHPASVDLIQQLVRAARESVRQFELARESISGIGCLLTADPDWRPQK